LAFFRQHPVREDALSAYIDGALSGDALARVEAHLGTCERCRGAVEELRGVRSALQELPREQAPRSFALRRADVEAAKPAAPSGPLRASPMLGAVATIALLAFFSLVGLDVAAGPGGDDGGASRPGIASVELADDGAEPAAGSPDARAPTGEIEQRDDATAPGFSSMQPSAEATAPANVLSVDGEEATVAAPLPATGAELDAPEKDDDGRTGLRAAEAATAAVALVAGGTFALAWRRRRA